MPSPLPSTDDLQLFASVARLASFTLAAQRTAVPRSTVSTAVKRLEAQLGVRLLQRTTRRVVLTSEGEALLALSERLLDEIEELAGGFRDGAVRPQGRLRVDMPLGLATGIVMPRLPDFLARYPDLQIDLFSTDRRIDLIAEGMDCVVRAGPIVDDTLVCRPLGQLPLLSLASHGYIEEFGNPASPAELTAHFLINYQSNASDGPAGFEYVDGKTTIVVPMRHAVTVNNSESYRVACLAGLGIAQLPALALSRDELAGKLVEVMPMFRPCPLPLNLLYPQRKHTPHRVRVFGDWLFELLQELC